MASSAQQTRSSAISGVAKKEKRKRDYIVWSTEEFQTVEARIKDGIMSPTKLIEGTRVPRSTAIRYREIFRDTNEIHRLYPGRPRHFDDVVEDALLKYSITMHQAGYPLNQAQLAQSARNLASRLLIPTRSGEHGLFTDGWVRSFFHRHPQLSMRRPQLYPPHRAACNTTETYAHFFERLRGTNFDKLSPECIWNMDETTISYKQCVRKVLAARGAQTVKKVTPSHPTLKLLIAGNAFGNFMPLCIVSHGASAAAQKAAADADVGLLDAATGDLSGSAFASWVSKIFIERLPASRPQVLVMDNAPQHLTLEVFQLLADNKVSVVLFPPNTTDVLQPLDICFNRAIKARMRNKIDDLTCKVGKTTLGVEEMVPIIAAAFNETRTDINLSGGFRKAGLVPFNPEAVVPPPHRLPDELVHHEEPLEGVARQAAIQDELHVPAQPPKRTDQRRRKSTRLGSGFHGPEELAEICRKRAEDERAAAAEQVAKEARREERRRLKAAREAEKERKRKERDEKRQRAQATAAARASKRSRRSTQQQVRRRHGSPPRARATSSSI